MVEDSRGGHRTWLWMLLGATGLALVAAAVVLLAATGARTPTASAQADCTLEVTKVADVDIAPIGGDITYTIVVTNASDPDSPCTTGVTVTDTIPANTDCISATASGSGSFTAAGCDAEGDVVWTSGADLADAATATLTLVLRVTGGDGTTITNTAVVAGVDDATGGEASDDVVVNDCDLDISKDSDDDEVGEGGEIVYTITVENEGTADCVDVVITEDIPSDTDCIDTDVTDDSDLDEGDFDVAGCDSSGDVVWDDFDLDDGDTIEVTMTVELTSGAEDGDEIDNEACVTSDDTDEDVDICDDVTVDVEGEAATATPSPTATVGATPYVPPPVAPPVAPPAPVAVPAAELLAPATGTGTESGAGGSQPLALALGLAGLLLLSGSVMLRRPR